MTSPVGRLFKKGMVFNGVISVTFLISLVAGFPVFAAQNDAQVMHNTYSKNQSSVTNKPSQVSLAQNGQSKSLQHMARGNPQQPLRLLVKLEGQALIPYVKQERAKLGAGRGQLKSSDRQQLATKAQSHQQNLRKAQQTLLAKMRQEKLLIATHREFIDLTNTLAITAKAGDVARIKKLPGVVEVYLDNQVRANLEQSVPGLGLPDVWQRRDAQDRGLTGAGIKVAILDTGIDHTHPDLGGCLGANCKVVAGYNFTDSGEPDDAMDKNGHGTHVAGIVAANGELKGVAPGASLYAFKVLDNLGAGLDSGIIAALEKVVDPDGDPLTDDHMDVANLSLGAPGVTDSPAVDAANQAVEAGVVLVVAAGNEGSSYFTVSAPGTAEQVITVGAVDRENAIADFSSRGPVRNKDFIKPEIMAPGFDINSTAPKGKYEVMSGTSMATPHVAGAAALLLQQFPGASPAEIKARLLGSAQDVGLDIFEQGMGLLDVSAALELGLVAESPLLALGYVDIDQATWQKEFSVELSNLSEEPQAFEFLLSDTVPAGMTFSIVSETQQEIAAGESVEVNVQVTVDNALLPFSDKDSLHHQANLILRQNGHDYRLPVALFKAAQLELDVSSGFAWVHLYREEDDFSLTFDVDCEEQGQLHSLNLRPGTYHSVWHYSADQDCGWPDTLVLRRGIELTSKTQASASRDRAIYELSLSQIVDAAGVSRSLDDYTTLGFCATYWDKAMDLQQFSCGGSVSNGRVMKFNQLDADFKFSVGLFLQEKTSTDSANPSLVFFNHNLDEGLSDDKKIALDLRNLGRMEFEYLDAAYLSQGVTLVTELGQVSGLEGLSNISSSAQGEDVYHNAFGVTLFANFASLKPGEWFPGLNVSLHQDFLSEDYVWMSPLVGTGPLGFVDAESLFKVNAATNNYPYKILHEHQEPLISIKDNGYYLSGYFVYERDVGQIASRDYSFCPFCRGLQKDETHNAFGELMPYQVYCDGALVDEGQIERMLAADVSESPDCDQFEVRVEMNTRFQGINDTSTVEAVIALDSVDEWRDWIESLAVHELALLDSDTPTRVLKGPSPEVRLVVAPSGQFPDAPRTLNAKIEFKLAGDTDWTNLPLTQSEETYVAKLPVMTGSHTGSLRVSVADDKGNTTIQTLNSIFLLGSGAEGGWRFPILPALSIEATGPLTPYELPEVRVTSDGGVILQATTEDLGPYAVGEHAINWRATTPQGAELRAVQELVVIDTVPPQITVETYTSVITTAGVSVVNPVQASAIDLVDGEVNVTPDKTGPFAVGEHQIFWEAADSSGNLTLVAQTLIVTTEATNPPPEITPEPEPTPTPTPTPVQPVQGSKSGGGSSGSVFLLLLCLIAVGAHRRVGFAFKG